MKILIINYEYPPLGGGGGVATKQTAQELAKRHEVHVLTSINEGGVQEEELHGVRIHRVAVSGRKELPTATLRSMITFVPKALSRGFRLCREIQFDVLNAQFVLPSGIPARFLASRFRIPFVVSFIGGDLYDPTKGISPHRHWYLRLLIRWVVRGAVICTAISEDTKKRAQKLHGITKEIVVTHLGYVPTNVPERSRTELNVREDVPLAVSIARLIPRKGYKVLLQAWKKVPDAQLVIIGEGPLRDELSTLISELALRDRVKLVGFVAEERKLQYLRAADLYVSASEHEGFGIVFLEAMAAGLPLIAMNEGGHTDFLVHEKNALLLDLKSDELLATSVRDLLRNDELQKRMAKNNEEVALGFTVEKVTKKFEGVLELARSL